VLVLANSGFIFHKLHPMNLLIQLLLLVFAVSSLVLWVFFNILALVAYGCANLPSERRVAFCTFVIFLAALSLVVVSLLSWGLWGTYPFGLNWVNPLFVAIFLGVFPLSFLYILRRCSFPSTIALP
jgi:hypothetical protein